MLQTSLAPPDDQTARNAARITTPAAASRLVPAALFVTFAALLVPVLVAAIPPLEDYPNHLARLWLLSGGTNLPPVSEMYRVSWDTFTNIGIDLLTYGLGGLVPYEIMGRVFVAASVLLPPLGGVLLWRTVYGGTHWWQLAFGLLAWSAGVVNGFLNFEIGLGLALLAAAADPALARRGPATAAVARALLAALLMLMHVFALAFYAALLAGLALGPDLRALGRRDILLRAAQSILAIGAALALPAVLLVLFAPSLPGAHEGRGLNTAWQDLQAGFALLRTDPVYKVNSALLGVRAYSDRLDVLTLAVLGLPVLASLLLRRLKAHAGLLLAVAGLMACYLVLPDYLAGTFWIDRRFALMAPLALAAALRPDLPPRPAGALAAALVAMSLVRTGHVASVWHERQADVASLRRALASVPPGAAILPLEHRFKRAEGGPPGRYTTMGEPSHRHMHTLALPWRLAFVPTLFTARGKQPLEVLPPWNTIVEPDGGTPPSVNALTDPAILARFLGRAPYARAWRERFDYALVLNADMPDDNGPFTPPDGVELVADEGFAQLYRINRAALPAPAR